MIDENTLKMFSTVLQWIVAPVAAFVWLIHNKQQQHSTDIAVLYAETAAAKLAHDREMKEIRETTRAIMLKLDSIEEALRT